MNWVSTAIMLLNLSGALITAMKALEDAIPASGQGEQKSAAIKAMLEATNDKIDIYWPVIQKAINALATLFNATGTFNKSA